MRQAGKAASPIYGALICNHLTRPTYGSACSKPVSAAPSLADWRRRACHISSLGHYLILSVSFVWLGCNTHV